MIGKIGKLASRALGAVLKDKLLIALVLALVAALVLTLAKHEPFDPQFGMQYWGCPKGQVEYEKGCYNPKTKTYKPGKHIIDTPLN